jgi:hypothetical protein
MTTSGWRVIRSVAALLIVLSLLLTVQPVVPGQSSSPAGKSSWLSKQNIYVFYQPPLRYLNSVGATGTTWSVFYSGRNEADLEYVHSLQAAGYRVCSNFPTVQSNITDDQHLILSACCRDIHKQPATFPANDYFMCFNNPDWQSFLKARMKDHIRGGVDAVHIDEIALIGKDVGAGFCPHCLAAFNSYLKKQYNASELSSKFGIQNIDTFDYRTYLLANGATSIWDDPNQDLSSEYLQSQYLARAKVMHELIQYGRRLGHGKVLFSGNLFGLLPSQQINIADLDFVVFEQETDRLPEEKLFVTYLLGEAMAPGKPFVGYPVVPDLAALGNKDWPLFRHWMTESFACGASFLIPYQGYTGGKPYTLPAKKIAPATKFLNDNVAFYNGVSRFARVGLYHDLFSLHTNTVYWKAHVGWQSFMELGRALEEAHIPFAVVYKGDPRYYNKPLKLQDLTKYDALVLPLYTQIDAATQTLFTQFENQGGQIIKADDYSSSTETVAQLGKIGLDVGLETNASKDLGIMICWKGADLFIHLVNYQYNAQRHRFANQNNIRITASIPTGITLIGKTLRLMTPDSPKISTLTYTVAEGKVTFTVPSVLTYGLCVCQ